MRFSFNWLKELTDFDAPVEQLADLLSQSGTKVESVTRPSGDVAGVIVAEVLDIVDHPNAEKLTLVDVRIDSDRTERVVCGARNIAVGDKVPLATVGAQLPGMDITERKIRGEISRGMLCSPAELGLSRDQSGILVLPTDAVLGEDVTRVMGLDDVIFEVEVTPNRGDCMGMIGIAREVAAVTGGELRAPDPPVVGSTSTVSPVRVEIADPEGCRRYVARYASGISIAPSPSWMQARLTALGVRPISNVVDITNYVLLETGHPLHAFDAAKIADQTIVVRRADDGEMITTLDGQKRELQPGDLLIADPERAVAIAGVMGGEDSEVSEETTSIILEAAHFDHASVSLTSQRHALRTEASARFERGADPEMPPRAAARAMQLMVDLAAAEVSESVVDEYPGPWTPHTVTLRPGRTTALLGYPLSKEEQAQLLGSVQLKVDESSDALVVEVPSFRAIDLTREVDLVEEVARLAGFGRLPATLPPGRAGGLESRQAADRRIRRILSGLGLTEAWTRSFGSPAELDALGLDADHPARRMVELENPTSAAAPTLRTTLLPGLLRSAALNVSQRAASVALYEIARVYEPTTKALPREALILAGVLCGLQTAKGWRSEDKRWDFFAAKGVLEATIASMEAPQLQYGVARGAPFHPTRAAALALGGEQIGALGELHPDVCERTGVPEGTIAFEIALEPIFAALPGRAAVEELSRYPAVHLDLAVVVDGGVAEGLVEDVIRRAGAPELERIHLFDVYRGEQVPSGQKSLAYSLQLRSAERTLTDEDGDGIVRRILVALQERTGARLRT